MSALKIIKNLKSTKHFLPLTNKKLICITISISILKISFSSLLESMGGSSTSFYQNQQMLLHKTFKLN